MATNAFNSKAENKASKAQDYAEFGKLNLMFLRDGVENILKLIGKGGIFHEYTLHDMTHIDAMLELLDTLIPEQTANIMTPADWLLIVLACYFHDLGMLVTKKEYEGRDKSAFTTFRDETLLKGDVGTDYKDALSHLTKEELEKFYYQEFVRDNHADRIYYWVNGRAKEELGASHDAVDAINTLLDGIEDKVRKDLGLICRSHHLDNLDQIDSLYVLRRAYGKPPQTHTNLQYCALLLRTADLLQIEQKRVPSIMYKLIDPANPISQDEWAKQEKVRAVLPTKSEAKEDAPYDTIEVQAEFDKANGFFGLTAYLQYAESQLKLCAEWAQLANTKGAKHGFPWRAINDDQVEASGFLPQKYQFVLDREKILGLLTGHTLYNDSTVAIREILQNAIDAVRFQKHLTPDEEQGKVEVSWNPETNRLVVRDTGVGMTGFTIEKHLLNIGSSYYQDAKFKERYPDFSPISKFGIGVLSYFMISNDVQILTVHPDEEMAHQVMLPSATQRYLIKLVPKDGDDVRRIGAHGTQVSMLVRRSANLQDIEEILRYWIVLPQCQVTLVVKGGDEKAIGFSTTGKALDYYLRQSKRSESLKSVKVMSSQIETDGGKIDLAYAVRYWRWFKVWGLLSRYGFYGIEADEGKLYKEPAGACVEGIRVSSDPPGYTSDGMWAIANLTGSGSPRTNVARTDLEQTPELTKAYSGVYKALAKHVEEQFEETVKAGGGITKASIDADFMTDDLQYNVKNREELRRHIDALRIVTIEDEGNRKTVSRKDLRDMGSVWVLENPLIDHIDGVCESMEINLSYPDIIERLTGKAVEDKLFPRLVGKRTKALQGFEVAEIRIDPEAPSIATRWAVEQNRWQQFTKHEISYAYRQGLSRSGGMENMLVAVGEVEFDSARIKVVRTRGITLFLQKSPVAILRKACGNDTRITEWIIKLAIHPRIAQADIPRFRVEMKDLGLDANELLEELELKEDETFDLQGLVR